MIWKLDWWSIKENSEKKVHLAGSCIIAKPFYQEYYQMWNKQLQGKKGNQNIFKRE